jgi:transcriptional regulatory protein LEU3
MSNAMQFGKLSMVQRDDYLICKSREWYRSSRLSLNVDIHLCHYVEMLRVVDEFRIVVGDKTQQLQHEVV